MAQQNFNVSLPNDGLGDELRAAFIKQQTMNTELYTDKVDKVIGKDLSTNDFTDLEQSKLSGIEPLAQVNVPINFSDLVGAPVINSIAAFPDAKFDYVDTNSFDIPLNVQAISVRKNGNPTEIIVTNWTQNANVITYAGLLEVGDYLIISGVYVIGSAVGITGLQSVVAGANITVDNTDPLNPIFNAPSAGATNIGNTPNPTGIALTSTTGTGSTLPATTEVNAGLLLPAEKSSLATLNNLAYGQAYLDNYRSRILNDLGTSHPSDSAFVLADLKKNNLLNKASLIITPSATKASKLFAIKPQNGNGDLTAVRNTIATRVNEDLIIESVAANVPRIDYTDGEASILIEPQRTNLFSYSEQFDNSYWAKNRATILVNNTTSPEGIFTADKLIEDTSLNTHFINRNISNSNSLLSFSIFAKKGERNFLYLNAFATAPNNFSYNPSAYFNLNNGTVGNVSNVNATMEDFGNGWYRCTLNFTSIFNQSSSAVGIYIYSAISNGNNNYQGDGASGLFIWGAQIEQGSNASSYIPTVASAVTRNAEVISKTGISDLIGQSEGTIFLEAEIQKRNSNDFYIAISNGNSLSEAIHLNQPSSGNINVLFRTAGLTPTINVLSANWNVGINKIVITYTLTLGKIFINGAIKGTVPLTALPTCNKLSLASRPDSPGGLIGFGAYKRAELYKTALTDAECVTLTKI
jgi:hypothetical protein